MSATLYLFVGPPGAGKTTVANFICRSTGAMHIWADRERQAMFGHPTHDAEESRELYEHLNQKTATLLSQGSSVVFDTSFNFRKDRDHLRNIAEEAGARVVIIHLTTPHDLAKQRATHGRHAERNGMPVTMSQETFDRIAGHYQPLGADEPAVELDGSNLDDNTIAAALDIA